jgi:Acetyltransferase (GNAT) domain
VAVNERRRKPDRAIARLLARQSVRNCRRVTKMTHPTPDSRAKHLAPSLLDDGCLIAPPLDRATSQDSPAPSIAPRDDDRATGYLSAAYAASLAEFGTALALPGSGSWLLRRAVAPAGPTDAMGPYPLFCCRDWDALADDLADLGARADRDQPSPRDGGTGALAAAEVPISVVVVTDPFGDHHPAALNSAFPARVAPFKEHFVADLSRPLSSFVSTHHRRYALRDAVAVERCAQPLDWLDDWCALYQNLCARHAIRGIPALSRPAFARQLAVPGLHAFRASAGGVTVGMVLWYRQNDVAYYHLAAYSDEGYRLRASFPLFWLAFEHLAAAGVGWASLGAGASAGAGASGQGTDGLIRFKRGWSTATRTTYLCGRIFRPDVYATLAQARGCGDSKYFPAYRHGELA